MNLRARIFWQLVSLAILAFVAGMAIDIAHNAAAYEIDIFRTVRSGWFLLFAGFFAIEAAALAFLLFLWLPIGQKLTTVFDKVTALRSGWRIAGLLGLIGLLPAFPLVVIHPTYVRLLDGLWVRASLFLFLSLAGMVFLKLGRKNLDWPAALGWAALAQAVVYSFVTYFSQVNNYPFSQGWSEFSRYYGASLYFSERFYGMRVPLPVLNPAYHLMLTVPFLFGLSPIWVHRFWDVFLQVGLTAGLGLFFARRLKLEGRALFWYVAGWAFLFLMQGPIQPPQLVCALILLAGVAPGKFGRSTLIVFLASLWAGWCRVNWFPVPAALAAVVYFLEIPLSSSRRWLSYLWKPALWVLMGTAVAYASNLAYMAISGNGAGGNFASSLTSDMLWYRLLPSQTYRDGVLPDTLLASLPVAGFLVLSLRRQRGAIHPLRLAGIFAALAVLMLGGLVVSAKIGGGADLHNLDAYLILLMLVGGYLFSGQARADNPGAGIPAPGKIGLAMLAAIVPIWFAIQASPAFLHWNDNLAGQALRLIRIEADEATARGEEVLFVSQRHLLTFGEVDVPLVPEYDQVTIMEMVMSHNQAYLEAFQADLRAQRFGMIVLDPQTIQYYGRSSPFGEENDYWVDAVSTPLLCYYEPAIIFQAFPITLYFPSDQPCR